MRSWTRKCVIIAGLSFFVSVVMFGAASQYSYAGEAEAGPKVSEKQTKEQHSFLGPAIVLGASFAIGTSCLGAGYAVARVGTAAFGAVSERPELITRALLFVALAEGIAIYGLVVAVMLIGRL